MILSVYTTLDIVNLFVYRTLYNFNKEKTSNKRLLVRKRKNEINVLILAKKLKIILEREFMKLYIS